MNDARVLRLAGWAGIAFSILSLAVVPFAYPPPPTLGASGAAFAAWYDAHRTGFLIGNYLGIAAFVPGFLQLAVLADLVRRREGASTWLSSLVISSGTFAYAFFGCSLVVFQVYPFLTAARLEPAMEAMGALGAIWFALDGLAALPFVLAVGLAAVNTGMLPRWFANASWVLAVLALVMSLGALSATPAWLAAGGLATFVGFVAFFAWTFALGVIFLQRGKAPAAG